MNVVICIVSMCIFFFKQKTAYELRISDWSSDVCSSDLWLLDDTLALSLAQQPPAALAELEQRARGQRALRSAQRSELFDVLAPAITKIGRASCRDRVFSTCRSRWSPYH